MSFYCIVWVWVDSGLYSFYAFSSNSYRSSDHRDGLEVLPEAIFSEAWDAGLFAGEWAGLVFYDR